MLSALTLTELPILGDYLAVAAEALTTVGAVAVCTTAFSVTWITLTFIHIYRGSDRGKDKRHLTGIINLGLSGGP